MIALLIAIAFSMLVTVGWLMMKVAPWTAPLSGIAGFAVFIVGVYMASGRVMGFGGGLFAFSAYLFIAGAGMYYR